MKWLITGGLGFIGTNLIEYLIERGECVFSIDDKSRSGVEFNERYLMDNYKFISENFDIANRNNLTQFFYKNTEFDAIIHLAGQVSFMESLKNPYRDFEVNAIGTLNLLEHIRLNSPHTKFIGLSSNKVYGDLSYITYTELLTRYESVQFPSGFDESLVVEPKGPYSNSKSILDLYVQDYVRLYDLSAISFRQSSVYGPHQHPKSDQGWVSYFVREVLSKNQIQLNGRGKQVRDLLHVYDLCDLIYKLIYKDKKVSHSFFNVGGGVENSLSILELFDFLEKELSISPNFKFGEERPFDQKVFISNNSRIKKEIDWIPKIDTTKGLKMLIEELQNN